MKTDLLAALQRLDGFLRQAMQSVPTLSGMDAQHDPYRGLYIDWEEVERLLDRDPGIALYSGWVDAERALVEESSPVFRKLAAAFGLSPFDLDTLIIALAPEIDLRYRRLYAYLQDDVTRKYPSIDLVLHLLCPSAEARLLRRAHFAPGAPLIQNRLIHLDRIEDKPPGPLLAFSLRVDEQLVNWLLDLPGLDSRLAPFCELIEPYGKLDDLLIHEDVRAALDTQQSAHHLYFGGPQDPIKRQAVEALAGRDSLALLVVDVLRALAESHDFATAVHLILREAWLRNATLFFDDFDVLMERENASHFRNLLRAVEKAHNRVVVAGSKPCPTDVNLLSIEFLPPDYPLRRTIWMSELQRAGLTLSSEDVDMLAGHYQLNYGQIAQAVVLAARRAITNTVNRAALANAARNQVGDVIGEMAQKIEPGHTWDEIILPEDSLDQLRELCARFTHQHRVLGTWGFGRKLSRGTGTAALFAGPSGTGKTMAAEIIASTLNLDLYRIDLSQVVSKYIGETEKNLSKVFQVAAHANVILFFDEADALFGKRTEVRDSHDRYANIEISYLLQQMETYEGISILATNLRQNIDSAFLRRLAFAVHFPFPDEHSRRLIWEKIWPENLPLAKDVDLAYMAKQFKLSGGNIKNVALAAAFLAADSDEPVGMKHLLHATRRELEKSGKMLTQAELNGFYAQPTGEEVDHA